MLSVTYPWRATMFAAAVASVALLCATIAGAQEAPSLAINQVETGAYPDMRAVVTALDASGVPAPGLTADSFQALEDGQPVTITGVQPATDPALRLSVVLVIDTSGSMAGEPLDRAKQAATEFVNRLGPNDEASLIAFADSTVPVTGFTTDKGQLSAGIAGLQAVGPTALYDAVQASVFTARASASPRKAVVLLSDGANDSASPATEQGSLDAARGAAVPIFTVGLGAAPAAYLQTLSATTRGQYSVATATDVGGVYEQIATLLRSQYVVTLRGSGAADGGESSLELVATVDGAPAAATVAFVRGAAGASAPPPPPPAEPAPAESGDGASAAAPDSGTDLALIVFGAIVGFAALVAGLIGLVIWRRRARLHRRQMEIVAPNAAQAEAQPLPPRPGIVVMANGRSAGTGRLIQRTPEGEERTYELGSGPVVIGSSRTAATIVLPESPDVAHEHARIWRREGHYMLHHAGGLSRKTLVAGRECDWVVLEPGDEIQIGRHRFLFDDPSFQKEEEQPREGAQRPVPRPPR